MVLAFLLFGVIHTPDGPFVRPHPGESFATTLKLKKLSSHLKQCTDVKTFGNKKRIYWWGSI